MQRLKNTGSMPTPRPTGNLLAGLMIGSAILTMATHAALLGASVAVKQASIKNR